MDGMNPLHAERYALHPHALHRIAAAPSGFLQAS
jgi:hypothetical protein